MSEIVHSFDTQGRLMSCGFEWLEERSFVTAIAVAGIAIGIGGMAFALAALFKGAQMPMTFWQLIAAYVAASIVGYGGCLLWDDYRFVTRAIVFHRDGRILMPSGVPGYFGQYEIDGSHQYITSVGKLSHKLPDRNNMTYSVGMYAKNGNVIHITPRDYSHDFAHLVAVQVTNALEELRATLASPHDQRERV